MGKSTISMAIFHCYVSSPEGKPVNFPNKTHPLRCGPGMATMAAEESPPKISAKSMQWPGTVRTAPGTPNPAAPSCDPCGGDEQSYGIHGPRNS